MSADRGLRLAGGRPRSAGATAVGQGHTLIYICVALAAAVQVFPGFSLFAAIAVLCLPATARYVGSGVARWGLICALVWLVAQTLSDFIHHLPSRPSVFAAFALSAAAAIPAYSALLRHFRLSEVGLAASVILGAMLNRSQHLGQFNVGSDLWKYLLADFGTFVLLILAAPRFGGRVSQPRLWCVVGVLTLINFQFDYRSYLTVVLLTALLLVPSVRGFISARPVVSAALGLVLTGLLLFSVLPYASRAGWLGARSREQSAIIAARGGTMLTSVRPEFVQAAVVTARHPALGVGSRSILASSDYEAVLSVLTRLHADTSPAEMDFLAGTNHDGLATHSMAFDTSARGGITTLGFWSTVLVGALGILRRRRLSPPLAFVAISTLWNMFFSPLANAQILVICLVVSFAAFEKYKVAATGVDT